MCIYNQQKSPWKRHYIRVGNETPNTVGVEQSILFIWIEASLSNHSATKSTYTIQLSQSSVKAGIGLKAMINENII